MNGIVTLLSMGFFLPTWLHVERIAPGINSTGWREQKVIEESHHMTILVDLNLRVFSYRSIGWEFRYDFPRKRTGGIWLPKSLKDVEE